MSNRQNVEALNAELAGVQCRVDQLVEIVQRRSIGESVSRSEFNEVNGRIVEALDTMRKTLETVCGTVEAICDELAEFEHA